MTRGGARKGAGRPKTAKEPTKVLRLPLSVIKNLQDLSKEERATLPLYSSRVQAGMPMPADDHTDERVDLHSYLVDDPDETFLVHATGDSMIDAGIPDGTLLVVNRKLKPTNGKVVVAAMDGQVTVKYLIMKNGKPFLMPANPAFDEIPIDEETGVTIWGVVTRSIQTH